MASRASGFNPDLLLAHKFPETTFSYSESFESWLELICFAKSRDAVIYALGVGACGRDAVDVDEFKYVYHENGQQFIQVLPTFAALLSLGSLPNGVNLPGIEFDPRLLLHGQQYIEIYKPLPSSGHVYNKSALAGLHDKGKAAILEIETKSCSESGELLCMNRITVYLRGAGGFLESSDPYSYTNYSTNQVAVKIPKSQPFVVFEDCTQPSQACFTRAVTKVAGQMCRKFEGIAL